MDAFVFYSVGSNILRWNVDSSDLHSNVVNPATKAIRYYIASDAYSAANRSNEINAVRACFDQWQSISGSKLRFEFAGLVSPENLDVRRDNTNVVFWAKNTLLYRGGEINLFGRRAWTDVSFTDDGRIVEVDIVLNAIQFQWFTDFNNTASQASFIESVVLHEIGHLVGLDHSPAGGATVVNGGNGVNTEAGLSADEFAAMRFLYPDGTLTHASVSGTVRMNGGGILGAMIIAEDSVGNIAGATVSRSGGPYDIFGLVPGMYRLRVCPFDPANSGPNSLMRGDEIAPEYRTAVTSFLATGNTTLSLSPGEQRRLDFSVVSGNPSFRIQSISKPALHTNQISSERNAVSILPGQSNYLIAVSSPTLKPGSVLSVSGDGVTIGPTEFIRERFPAGVHSLYAPISVSSNATPGLRSFMVTHEGSIAHANGFLEIATAVPDYNFDALNDRFQRQYWDLWTAPEASPRADPDADQFSNSFEYRMGTVPVDSGSFRLAIDGISSEGQIARIIWQTDPEKRYQLSTRSNLTGAWQAAGPALIATGEVTTASLPILGQSGFYRIELLR
jgi:hypothetical protein